MLRLPLRLQQKAAGIFWIAVTCCSTATFLNAQTVSEADTLLAADKDKLMLTLEMDIRNNYVFPDLAIRLADDLEAFRRSPQYSSTTDAKAFAALLKKRLQGFAHDKHLGVEYSANPGEFENKSPTPEERERQRRVEQGKNFCFQRVERMAGNIGYLDLRCFDDPAMAGSTATAAFEFLSNADALIIDLRHNGGGSPNMVAFLISYLVGSEPVQIDDLHFRAGDKVQQFWTLPYIPGKRIPNKDVFVLTSNRTFSAAEGFSYDLQTLKRATIVGEVTRGGANFGAAFRLSEHMVAFIPIGRAVNPITHTNWEGVGVHPDVPVAADQALDTAYVLALQKARDNADNPQLKSEIETALKDAQGRLNR